MYPACLSDVCEDENYFLKLTRAQQKKNNSHPQIDLKDKLDTFLESSDNA